MTRVVNILKTNCFDGKGNLLSGYVYIGRRNRRYNLSQSFFHNPYSLRQFDNDRAACLDVFRGMIEMRFGFSNFFRRRLLALDNKILVCWCKPELCHGDVLIEYLEKLKERNNARG